VKYINKFLHFLSITCRNEIVHITSQHSIVQLELDLILKEISC